MVKWRSADARRVALGSLSDLGSARRIAGSPGSRPRRRSRAQRMSPRSEASQCSWRRAGCRLHDQLRCSRDSPSRAVRNIAGRTTDATRGFSYSRRGSQGLLPGVCSESEWTAETRQLYPRRCGAACVSTCCRGGVAGRGVVGLALAVVGVIGATLPILALVVAAICAFLFAGSCRAEPSAPGRAPDNAA